MDIETQEQNLAAREAALAEREKQFEGKATKLEHMMFLMSEELQKAWIDPSEVSNNNNNNTKV